MTRKENNLLARPLGRREFLIYLAAGFGLLTTSLSLSSVAHADTSESARERWQKLTPDQKEKLRVAYRKFKSASPERQQALRENFKRWQSLPPEKREALRRKWRKWQSLSPERRQIIRDRIRQRRPRRQRQ